VTKHAVAVSPHLDDAVFSAGGVLAGLAAGGYAVSLVTAFTGSVAEPTGFALRCQTERGIPPEVDYMALRRVEDRRAAELLGLAEAVHLDLPEAPHRGYHSPDALFHRVRPGDDAAARVAAALGPVLDARRPDLVLAPLGVGAHVDHLVVGEALAWLDHPAPLVRWRDVPSALREPATKPRTDERGIPIDGHLDRKLAACAAYGSQLGFAFGGEERMREQLSAFAHAEGTRLGVDGPAEALVEPPPDRRRERAKREEAERQERVALAKLRAQIVTGP